MPMTGSHVGGLGLIGAIEAIQGYIIQGYIYI